MVRVLVRQYLDRALAGGHCVAFLDKENCWGNLTNCRGVACAGLGSGPGGE